MQFSQDFIEKVREANNVVDIISNYTQLKRSGHRYTGLCPFPDHNEKTPSFSVSEDKQLYYCFGCKKSGNIYTFVQALQGLTFPEAVEYLANRAHIALPEPSYNKGQSYSSQRDKKATYYKINERVAQHFHKNLLNLKADSEPRAYCRQRQINEEIARKFKVGYAPASWHELSDYLKKIGAPLKEAEELGLVRKSNKSEGHFDLFRERLVFPIVSPTGQVLGFGGRALGDGKPKYLNSPESKIFHKGRVFYGLNETAKYIRTQDQVIVVEGYMDVIALYAAGIKNVVATLGTALTQDHARLLKRYTKNVLVLFDGDEAGKIAAERSLPLLLEEMLLPKALFLPEDMDPDDYLKKYGTEKLQAQMARAPELFSLVLEDKTSGFTGQSTEKVAIMDQVAPFLTACKDSRLLALYIDEIVDRLNVEESWVRGSLKKEISGRKKTVTDASSGLSNQEKAAEITEASSASVEDDEGIIEIVGPVPKAEVFLLNLALDKEKYFNNILGSGIVDKFSHRGVAEVLARAQAKYRQDPSKFDKLTALLVTQVKPPEILSRHLDQPLSEVDEEGAKKLIQDCSRKVQEGYEKRKSRELLHQLRHADPTEQKELEQFMNIQRGRRGLPPKDA